ncbi:hypothetical protein Pla163_10760 [Planctomycetes bacterium Pla163]|uniref:DUF6930 domain-containing protein n=1 Tax=Rohdeia mirabilis TaxID=2528008 RepID=A0A518CXM1_9BACT|nr:hypothetical protein Pla163_10760 [Planctomycetes bacterium Pla163]
MVLKVELGRESERERWVLDHLVGAWRERSGIPGRVVVRERTAEWLGDALERLGVTVSVSDGLPMLEPARDGLLAQLERS